MATNISLVGSVVRITDGAAQPIDYVGVKGSYSFNAAGTILNLNLGGVSTYAIPFDDLEVGGAAPADVDAAYTALSTVFPNPNGGSGGSTIYTGNGELEGNRIVDLDGNILKFTSGVGINQLEIDPSPTSATITGVVFNDTDDGNTTRFQIQAYDTASEFRLNVDFNNGVKEAVIFGYANTDEAEIEYTADTHTFNGEMQYNGNAKLLDNRTVDLDGNIFSIEQDGDSLLILNPNTNNGQSVVIGAKGGTLNGESRLSLYSNDDDGGIYGFNLSASNGTNDVGIVGNAPAESLTFSGDAVLNSLAGNGAGIVAVDNNGLLTWMAAP